MTCSCISARDLLVGSSCFPATFLPGTLKKQSATQKTQHEGDVIAVTPKEDVKRQFSKSSFCVK